MRLPAQSYDTAAQYYGSVKLGVCASSVLGRLYRLVFENWDCQLIREWIDTGKLFL
jgi:hypothetical protein